MLTNLNDQVYFCILVIITNFMQTQSKLLILSLWEEI
jgi:hypothetical protein